MIREVGVVKADNEAILEFVKSEYVIGWFVLELEQYVVMGYSM